MPEQNQNYCVVMTTASDQEQARSLASSLLGHGLAACVQILPIHSLYVWQGAIANEPETLVLIKTRRDLYDEIETVLQSEHSYDVPEVICLPITSGSDPYLQWITEVTRA